MKRRGLSRPRHVGLDDRRSPMLRLLQDCTHADGSVQPNYEPQFKTLFKAMRIGYVDNDCRVTESGRDFLARHPR